MPESRARTTLDALLDGTLAPEAFSHRDHLVAAFQALQRHTFADAHALLAEGIRALAERAGAPEKFNATITFAYMSAIAERMASSPCEGADGFLAANTDLLDRGFLASCYSPERLATPLARSVPLLPDRAPT